MRILLTNDDGIDAPGLQALQRSVIHAVGSQIDEMLVVAPDRGRSECGHSVTITNDLRVEELRPGWHQVSGTPVDCVRVAIHALQFDPDLVFSGVNAGANLGVHLMVSGTFAAAREAATLGIPAMAISHYRRPDVPKTWSHVPSWSQSTIQEFIAQATSATRRDSDAPLWNVNLPAIDPTTNPVTRQRCPVDTCPLRPLGKVTKGSVEFELDFHGRPRNQGSDVDYCFQGMLTISHLSPHWISGPG